MSSTPDLFCSHCGDALPPFGAGPGYCARCARTFKKVLEPARGDAQDAPRAWRPAWAYDPARITPKDPLLAPVLSAVIPGGGQVYNAHFVKAALIFATSPLVIPWLIGIVDAYVSARRINTRWVESNLRPA